MQTNLTFGDGNDRNWCVTENGFDPSRIARSEGLFAQGNGYLGLRGCLEEAYPQQDRLCVIAGTFNKPPFESSCLPNMPDVTELTTEIDGIRFHLEHGAVREHRRTLDLRDGALRRSIHWEHGDRTVQMEQERFVSQHDLHLVCARTTIRAPGGAIKVDLLSGNNNRHTNLGIQHLHERHKSVSEDGVLQYIGVTSQSGIDVLVCVAHRFLLNGVPLDIRRETHTDRRRCLTHAALALRTGDSLTVEKCASYHTSFDRDSDGESLYTAHCRHAAALHETALAGYNAAAKMSAEVWTEHWNHMDVEIEGPDVDQVSVRFALYHLMSFAPRHDNRFGIGARGLSGHTYDFHTFWDTEVYMMPFYTLVMPEVAKNLVEFRHNTLAGARENARIDGYEGAQFPWQGDLTGLESTYAAHDPATGKTGSSVFRREIHIVADVAMAGLRYVQATGDTATLDRCVYEIVFEAASFFASRAEFDAVRGRFDIRDVIGPDEFHERVDNNAFTNHLAHWTLIKALELEALLHETDPVKWETLSAALDLPVRRGRWNEVAAKLYLPGPDRVTGFVEQHDGFFKLPKWDPDGSDRRGAVHIQRIKQADLVALLWLLPGRFEPETERAIWDYYEPICSHTSSLSVCMHALAATQLGDIDTAYRYFTAARSVDLDPAGNGRSADGIHSAAAGGLWQAAVMGFGGLRPEGDKLRIEPRLPPCWRSMRYQFMWRGCRIEVTVGERGVMVKSLDELRTPVLAAVCGNEIMLDSTNRYTFCCELPVAQPVFAKARTGLSPAP